MKRDDLKEYFRKIYSGNLLVEQDDLFGDEEEEETADDEAADEEGDTETEEEAPAEEEVEIEAGDEVRLNKPFEAQIDSILADFEMDALKSAQINVVDSEITAESKWWKKSLSDILLEQEEELTTEAELDIDLFASNVARLIGNYDVLLDMESILYNKARELLMVKYGEETAVAFDEILQTRHDIDLASPVDGKVGSPEGEIQPPLSVGAGGGEGGAA